MKENVSNSKTFDLLHDLDKLFKKNQTYLTTSFAISYFFLSSGKTSLEQSYQISTELCGENQSSKTLDEFKKSGVESIYINHGFTGSVYFLSDYRLESNYINKLKATNHFLYLVSNVVTELNFLTQNIIKQSVVLSCSDSYSEVEYHLNKLKNVREKIDSFIFDSYSQNVNEYAIDASIYDKAFETWEFDKYLNILKEQNKKIENLIIEFDAKLKHLSDKKLNVFVKLLTGFSATSVFVDIFSHIDIKLGFYFLVIPLVLLVLGFII
ncbi:MAG: hypothetical protein JXK05_00610 [Campylobacterales bacterium]|nr:hypothetical protein [Campylobacterales bacterium]